MRRFYGTYERVCWCGWEGALVGEGVSVPGNCASRPSFTEILSIRNFQLPSLLSAMSAMIESEMEENERGLSLSKAHIMDDMRMGGRKITCRGNDVFDLQKWNQSKFRF